MNLIEFFNSDQLELTHPWDNYTGSFDQCIADIFDAYLQTLRQVVASDYLSARVLNEYGTADALCTALKQCIQEYHLGHPSRAYQRLADAIHVIDKHIRAMFTVDDVAGATTHLYRIRKDPRRQLTSPELFHVPFEGRHKVATYRYSIPGLPCLYLGGSAYVCWEELGRPALDSIHLARFAPAAGVKLQVLDFGLRPALIAALIHSGRYVNQLSHDSPLADLVTAHAVCWPLVAAASIKVKHLDAPFKPEYIVPQLVLQWLTTEEPNIDGVRYFSTKVGHYLNDPMAGSNFVFPVRSCKATGYCDHLAAKFHMGDPVYWPSVMATAPAVANTPCMNFTCPLPTAMPYRNTDLARLQHCAASLPCRRI